MSIESFGETPTESDFAWASGFYEGEGTCVFIQTHHDRPYQSGRIEFKLSQLEREPLDRFTWSVGDGWVLGPYPNGRSSRPIFQWTLNDQTSIKKVMNKMWPWLSERRKSQYADALERMQLVFDYRAERNKTCRKGIHPRTGPGKCVECNKITRAAWLQRRKEDCTIEGNND